MIHCTTGKSSTLTSSNTLQRTISPLKKWGLQHEMRRETTNVSAKVPETGPEAEADRAIQVVKHKLGSRLSAEADVRRLIIDATDEGNLSRMYCGTVTKYPNSNQQGGLHLRK